MSDETRAQGQKPTSPGELPRDGDPKATNSSSQTDLRLLALGTVLVIVPVLVALLVGEPTPDAQFYMRVIAALGGGLVGSVIPACCRSHFRECAPPVRSPFLLSSFWSIPQK